MPVKYSKIDVNNISIEPLTKGVDGRYSDIFYSDSPLIIQTPYSLVLKDFSLVFSLVKKGNFYNIYDSIFDQICLKISELDAYKNKFSLEKVKQKISIPPIEVNEEGDGKITLQNSLDSIVKVYDYLMEETKDVSFDNLNENIKGSALLHIKRVLYKKTSISFEVVLVGIRLDSPKPEHTHVDILEDQEHQVEDQEHQVDELSDEDELILDEIPENQEEKPNLASDEHSEEEDFFFD